MGLQQGAERVTKGEKEMEGRVERPVGIRWCRQ